MKVEKTTSATGQWGLRAVPEDYDGTPPLPVVQFDRQPRTLSPDRVALASYLFFGPWISGRYTSPQWHSPALSQAISRDAQPAWLQTEPVELYAKALPKGRRAVTVDIDGAFPSPSGPTPGASNPIVSFLRSDQSVGSRMSVGSLELSTNAWLLGIGAGPDRFARIATGCGALFAEDMDADEVWIRHRLDPDLQTPIHDLAGAARLGVRFEA